MAEALPHRMRRSRSAWIRARDAAPIGVLVIATVLVLGKDITVGGFRDADASAHAMDGVLIHDWVAAGPTAWVDPMSFARQQYAHYPTLGIGRHYPPGFAVVEAAFFGLFGISPFTARLCVVFFGGLATVGIYVFTRFFADRLVATLAAVLWLTLPATVHWGRQTMLEVPTVAALAWAAVSLAWYLKRPSWARCVTMMAVALTAILFKQTAVFLGGALTMTLMVCAHRDLVRPVHCYAVGLMAIGAIVVVVYSLDTASAGVLYRYRSYAHWWEWAALTHYLRVLPGQLGPAACVAAAIGLFAGLRRRRIVWVFLAAWFFVSYVMVTSADWKVSRFLFVALVPFAVWGAQGLGSVLALAPLRRVRLATVTVIILGLCTTAGARNIVYHPDYGPSVLAHAKDIEGHAVLFSGLRDGDFVFAVRQHIPWRRAIVVRGSKVFYTCTAGPDLDLVEYAASPAELEATLRDLALNHVFVERENRAGVVHGDWLRSYLASGEMYRLAATHAIRGNTVTPGGEVMLDVYELAQPVTRVVEELDIPIPRTKTTIRVDLNGLRG